jgi:hypothetical protein
LIMFLTCHNHHSHSHRSHHHHHHHHHHHFYNFLLHVCPLILLGRFTTLEI